MPKGTWYRVEPAANAAGLRPLSIQDTVLPLAAGPWRARIERCGLEDEIIAGGTDTLRAAIAAGDKNTSKASTKGSETVAMAARLPTLELDFEVPVTGKLPLAISLVLDRGEMPDLIEEFRTQIIAKAPAGTTPAIVTAALTAAFPDVAIAVAVATFVAAADRVLAATFGTGTVLARPLDLLATAGESAPITLCLTHLPAGRSINVGSRPRPSDFAVAADGQLVETRRGRDLLVESAHEGWVTAQRTWVLLTLAPRSVSPSLRPSGDRSGSAPGVDEVPPPPGRLSDLVDSDARSVSPSLRPSGDRSGSAPGVDEVPPPPGRLSDLVDSDARSVSPSLRPSGDPSSP